MQSFDKFLERIKEVDKHSYFQNVYYENVWESSTWIISWVHTICIFLFLVFFCLFLFLIWSHTLKALWSILISKHCKMLPKFTNLLKIQVMVDSEEEFPQGKVFFIPHFFTNWSKRHLSFRQKCLNTEGYHSLIMCQEVLGILVSQMRKLHFQGLVSM